MTPVVAPAVRVPSAEHTDALARFLGLLWRRGEVREVRIPKHDRYGNTASGYFDAPEKLVTAVSQWDGRANVYLTLNPADPALFARAANRIVPKAEKTTADADIVARRWLLLDIDPKRPSGISSTDAELEAAREVLQTVTAYLHERGWPAPAEFMSGNGYWALYAIDLPNDVASLELVNSVLAAISVKFETTRAHIDTTVGNAARIAGLVGTLKMKGDSTEDRPHRRSRLESVPDEVFEVSRDQLEAEVARAPKCDTRPRQSGSHMRGSSARLADILERQGIEYREQPPDAQGVTWYHVRQCPFHDDGRPFECGVGQKLPDGPFAGKCFHPEGESKGWREWRQALSISFGPNGSLTPARIAQSDHPRIVITNRHLHQLAEEGWEALLSCNEPPVLFRHGDAIAEVACSDGGYPRIAHLGLAALRGKLDRAADWVRSTDDGDKPARPPRDVVEDMEALPKPLPVLRGITGTPTFTPDGILVATAGYQTNTGLYYAPSGEPVPVVPERPDDTDLKRAKQLIGQEWLADFPFVDDASRANAIAAAGVTIARDLIDGPIPLHAIDAPTPGTGKDLLATGVAIIGGGVTPAVMTEPRSEEELRKRITAILCSGRPIVVFGNIRQRLESGIFSALLTATTWSDRILGKTQTVELPNRTVWLATGNNLQLNNEMARRTAWIRLDAKVDRPWERTNFRHENLVGWLQRHRHELVWAFLVLIQHWICGGRPSWTGRPLGSYEAWSSVVGGILQAAGIEGFLANREELYRRTDAETEEWRAFTRSWWAKYPSQSVKASDLLDLALELLPTAFESAKENASERALRTRLGQAIAGHRDRRFGDLFIRRAGDDGHTKGALWRVEPVEGDADPADVDPPEPPTSAQHPQQNRLFADTNADVADIADIDSGVAPCF